MMIGSTADVADLMGREIDLFAKLADALELREEADTDSPPWAAEQEIRRLEHEIVIRLHNEARLSIAYAQDAAQRTADRQAKSLAMTRARGPLG